VNVVIGTYETSAPKGTLDLGRELGAKARPGTVFVIEGELGAGKTVMARGIAQGLGIDTWRGSPTFAIVHEYSGRLNYFHLDAYRITGGELVDLDLDRMFDGESVMAVEWGEKVLQELREAGPVQIIRLHLYDVGDDRRRIEIS
jgi:tRNA threonylcarbamoyladenosine biosynthesis protein TsaE